MGAEGVLAGRRRGPAVPSRLLAFADALGEIALLTRDAVRVTLRRPPAWRTLLEQLEQIGWRSLSIASLTALSTGMVLALQLGHFLERFGAKMFVSRILGVSLVREMGPILTALMLGGRVGAGITAELGTMAVTEQVDALRALGASPVRNLVVPRLLALHTALPLLTAESIALGIAAGYVVGVYLLGIDATYLWYNMLKYTSSSDVVVGLIKAFIFGGIVAIIGCYKGMFCGEGAEGVGRATTEAVVYSSITILITNFFLTMTLGKIFHTL